MRAQSSEKAGSEPDRRDAGSQKARGRRGAVARRVRSNLGEQSASEWHARCYRLAAMLNSSRRNAGGRADALTLVSRSRQSVSPRFALLRHPLFLGALALLVVNDHLLKGAGLLPGALTGKLSDLAGLVVAPVLAAAIVDARTSRGRALAFAAVAAPFAAIKLSAAAAQLLVGLVGLAGIRWRIWQDPTDLAALVVLVPAWRLSARAASSPGSRPGAPRKARAPPGCSSARSAGASAVACVATGTPAPEGYFTDAYLINATPGTVDVRVRWVDASLDCAAVTAGDPTRMFGPSAFNLGITYRLDPQDTLPLNQRTEAHLAAGNFEETAPTSDGRCEVVLLETDGLRPVMAWWSDLQTVMIPQNVNGNSDFWKDTETVAGRVALKPDAVVAPGQVKTRRAADERRSLGVRWRASIVLPVGRPLAEAGGRRDREHRCTVGRLHRIGHELPAAPARAAQAMARAAQAARAQAARVLARPAAVALAARVLAGRRQWRWRRRGCRRHRRRRWTGHRRRGR